MSVDLHLHTTASDGTEDPRTVVQKAHRRGLNIIAVTDHDTVSGLGEAREALAEGMTLINGIELSSAVRGEGGFRCHILGFGIDPDSPYIREAVELGMSKRLAKLGKRIEYLGTDFGIELTEAELEWLYSQNAPSKLHLAYLLNKRGLAADNNLAIKKYLDGGRLPDDRIDADMAISAIKRAGGRADFCPSSGRRGRRPPLRGGAAAPSGAPEEAGHHGSGMLLLPLFG